MISAICSLIAARRSPISFVFAGRLSNLAACVDVLLLMLTTTPYARDSRVLR